MSQIHIVYRMIVKKKLSKLPILYLDQILEIIHLVISLVYILKKIIIIRRKINMGLVFSILVIILGVISIILSLYVIIASLYDAKKYFDDLLENLRIMMI